MSLTDDDRLEALSNQLRALDAQLGEITDARNRVLALISQTIGEQAGPISAHGKHVLTVTYARRFNADLAQEKLPPVLIEAITETTTTISASKAKRTLAPALYEACQKYSDTPTIKAAVAR